MDLHLLFIIIIYLFTLKELKQDYQPFFFFLEFYITQQ